MDWDLSLLNQAHFHEGVGRIKDLILLILLENLGIVFCVLKAS